MKKYQVIFQDEWNNLYEVGFYDNLNDSIDDINDYLKTYNAKIDELQEYISTFSKSFDTEIDTESGVVMIRGFIHE